MCLTCPVCLTCSRSRSGDPGIIRRLGQNAKHEGSHQNFLLPDSMGWKTSPLECRWRNTTLQCSDPPHRFRQRCGACCRCSFALRMSAPLVPYRPLDLANAALDAA